MFMLVANLSNRSDPHAFLGFLLYVSTIVLVASLIFAAWELHQYLRRCMLVARSLDMCITGKYCYRLHLLTYSSYA